jgi:hypothetical protein
VLPGVIYSLLSGKGINMMIFVVISAIYCLNFAANPFVYCLRLKRLIGKRLKSSMVVNVEFRLLE